MILLRAFRRLYRVPAIFLWALVHVLYAAFVQCWFKDRVFRMARQTQFWGKGLLVLFGVKLMIHGKTAHEPRSTSELLVSNHTGYMDVFVHAAAFGLRFTPKSDIQKWPCLGWYVQQSCPVWIDRSSPQKSMQTLEEFRNTLRLGAPLIVYPEGTSTDGRSGLKAFKSTPFETIAGTDLPVQPLLTFYRTTGKRDCNPAWYGDMTLLPHLWKLLGNGTTYCDLYLLEIYHAPADAGRKQITQEVHDRMAQAYDHCLREIREKEAVK